MNFRTTLVLLGLLAVVGLLIWFTQEPADKPAPPPSQGTVLGLKASAVSRVTITGGAQPLTFEKTDGQWTMTAPHHAAVETGVVESLVGALANLRSTGSVDLADEASRNTTGLARPAYVVQVDAGDQTRKLSVGERSAVGDSVYVAVDSQTSATTVSASLLDQLEREAGAYRSAKLVSLRPDEVQQITIERPRGRTVLHRLDGQWRIVSPEPMEADAAEVSGLLYSITGLRAEEFVSEDPRDAGQYQLGDSPRLTVALSSAAPTTGPATTAPAATTIVFGRYDDLRKQSLFAQVKGSPSIVKVAAQVLSMVDKSPIDLRNRTILRIDSGQVSQVSLQVDRPATTQPTTRPASTNAAVIDRRPQVRTVGPVDQPGTQPATAPSTAPATAPAAEPQSKWVTRLPLNGAIADEEIDRLLGELSPLTVSKFIAEPAPDPVEAVYTLIIRTEGPGGTPVTDHRLVLTDRGQPSLEGEYDGLRFELPRTIALQIDSMTGAAPAAP